MEAGRSLQPPRRRWRDQPGQIRAPASCLLGGLRTHAQSRRCAQTRSPRTQTAGQPRPRPHSDRAAARGIGSRPAFAASSVSRIGTHCAARGRSPVACSMCAHCTSITRAVPPIDARRLRPARVETSSRKQTSLSTSRTGASLG